jgi:molybdenum cofactor guanylyltransferase
MLAAVKPRQSEPVGVVLAGGLGRRIGGHKAVVELAGTPLIFYPLRALQATLTDVRVMAKPGTALPQLPDGVRTWTEPEEPQHPLVGIVEALRLAAPRSVLVCAADMPFLTGEVLKRLAEAEPGGAPAVVAAHDGALEPLLGVYWQRAAELLAPAAAQATQPLRAAVAGLKPRLIKIDAGTVFNVNTAADLARAQALLSQT